MIISMKAKTAEQQRDIINELQRQQQTAKDYVVAESQLAYESADNKVGIHLSLPIPNDDGLLTGRQAFRLSKGAELQLFEKLGIPTRYGQRLRDDARMLLADNLNYWFGHPQRVPSGSGADRREHIRRFQVRTLDGNIRAILSPGYLALDSYDYFFHIMAAAQPKGATVKELTLTDERFSMFLVQEDWALNLTERNGVMDRMVPGLFFSNSETGDGRLRAELKWWKQSCGNGLVTQQIISRIHLGSQLPEGIVSMETRRKAAELVWSEVRDMVDAAFDQERFADEFATMQGLATEVVEDPATEVQKINSTISDDERNQIMLNIWKANDNTRWGVLNAITLTARQLGDAGDISRQHELERAAAEMVGLR